MLSSRLDETGGRELKHQYLQYKIKIFWSRWLLRPAGRQACHWGCKITVWGLALGSFTFLRMFGHFMGLFGVRRGFKMILSHRAPSSLNMSSYRAIWTHFRPNFIFFGPKNLRLPKIQTFPKMQISSSSHSHKYLTYMGR